METGGSRESYEGHRRKCGSGGNPGGVVRAREGWREGVQKTKDRGKDWDISILRQRQVTLRLADNPVLRHGIMEFSHFSV